MMSSNSIRSLCFASRVQNDSTVRRFRSLHDPLCCYDCRCGLVLHGEASCAIIVRSRRPPPPRNHAVERITNGVRGPQEGFPSVRLDHVVGRRLWLRGRIACRARRRDRKSTRLNSSHVKISYSVFCLKKKKKQNNKSSKKKKKKQEI